MYRWTRPAWALILLTVVGSHSAEAEQILAPYALASYSFTASYQGTQALHESGSVSPPIGAASLTGDAQGSFQGDAFDFSASASSTGLSLDRFGNFTLDFGAAASLNFDTDGLDSRFLSRADAASLSFFLFDYAPWTNRPGVATFFFHIDGVVSNGAQSSEEAALFVDSGRAAPLNPSNLFGQWSIDFISGNNCVKCQIWEFPQSTSQTVAVKIPFAYGQWNALSLDFVAVVSALSPRGTGQGAADFSHTLTLMNVVAEDEDGNLAPDASARVVSTTQVPEPSSLVLLVAGLGLLAACGGRARHRRDQSLLNC
ncbi:MAG TPA: PEP-CTERM sorting domain-containing protein [Vicinamibacterales bacterium]|nr:PEP-CTERM sorting domain-containing protein [Vicinamibacterales bacterium]